MEAILCNFVLLFFTFILVLLLCLTSFVIGPGKIKGNGKMNLPITKLLKVTKEQNIQLIKPITEQELVELIRQTKNEKCSGLGFTNKFYKEFYEDITPTLCKAFNWALESKEYATTWNSAIISVIYKPGKYPTHSSSYRPISLLNVDQKLLSSIGSNKIRGIQMQLKNINWQCMKMM
uniref:Reverse transcriptase domain-containing protein n=1 Tax=Echeneis naucrates TaxID=173247 RepID=A0A665U616_ECHNA